MLYWVQTRRSSLGRFCTMSSAVAASAYLAALIWSAGAPAARASDLELLDRLGDLVHELAGPGARQRRAQAAEQQQQRRGGARSAGSRRR